MSAAEPLRPAFALSLALHVLLGAWLVLSARAGPLPERGRAELSAAWAGDTFEVDEVLSSSEGQDKRRAGEPPIAAPGPAQRSAAAPETAPPKGAPLRAKPARQAAAPERASEETKSAERSAAPDVPARTAQGAPPPATSVGAAAAAAASPEAGGSGPSAGSDGVAPATADLAKAFAKAVTAATHRDPIWDELPLGNAGYARVLITVGESGSITSSALDDEKRVPPHIARLVERTLGFLRSGRFALSGSESTAGSQVLEIEVVLSSVEPAEDYDDPRHTVSLGFEPPRLGKHGRAYFVHASGRRFEAKISIADAS